MNNIMSFITPTHIIQVCEDSIFLFINFARNITKAVTHKLPQYRQTNLKANKNRKEKIQK